MRTEETGLWFDALRSRILRMGERIERQLIHTLDGLASGDVALLDKVIEDDWKDEVVASDLDRVCSCALIQRQDGIGTLRFATAVANIISDLERIGDETKSIAQTSKRIHANTHPRLPGYRAVRSAASITLGMLRKVLDAFARQEVSAAAQVAREDGVVRSEFRSVVRLLATFMMEGMRAIPVSVDVLFVAMSIQRIGDYAANIAEHVVDMTASRHMASGQRESLGVRAVG